MNQQDFDRDQQSLVNFLRQHRPDVPPPAANLEQLILSQIAPHQDAVRVLPKFSFNRLWLLPTAIATAAIITWQYTRPMQPVLSQSDRQNIEASLVTGWSAVISEDAGYSETTTQE